MAGTTSFVAVEDLDAAETLAAAEAGVRERHAVEVHELEIALHWADLHGASPADEAQPGGPRLVRLGGVGTPRVLDLAVCELAVARGQHSLAARALLAEGWICGTGFLSSSPPSARAA